MRPDGRNNDELRQITFERNFTDQTAGSVLVSFGRTKVLCTVSIDDDVPRWMRGKGEGWVTAEYSMLPGSSHERVSREAKKGKQKGRTLEIERLIGRALRAVCDMKSLGEREVTIDCDVLQADGGTRTASICGGYVALHDALSRLVADGTGSRSGGNTNVGSFDEAGFNGPRDKCAGRTSRSYHTSETWVRWCH